MSSPTRNKPGPPPRKESLESVEEVNTNKDLKEVAKRAVLEHETLKRKFSKKEEEAKILQDELEATRGVLDQIQSVSGQVIQEYADVQTKLQIETKCREEAEKYARKTVRDIKELKRKSQMLFVQNGIDFSKIVDISLDDDPEEDSLEDEGQLAPQAKELERQLQALKEELCQAKKDVQFAIAERDERHDDLAFAQNQVAQLKDQLKHETLAHEKTKKALQERDNIINQLKRVSALVYDEYNEVQSLYQKESVMREEAEKLATEYYAKNKEAEAFKRQSQMLLSDALSGDTKLLESLSEVEKLTKDMEEMKETHKLELKRLRDELELSEDREKMELLENKLSIAKEENMSLEKQVEELATKNKELAYELKEAQNKPSLPNIPPPPPPPPMPALPKNPLEMLQKLMSRKQHKSPSPEARQLDSYQKQFESAMQEMVNRIRRGEVTLRKTNVNERPPEKKVPQGSLKSPAVKELDDILTNIKKNRKNRPIVLPKGTTETVEDAKFQALMEQRRLKSMPEKPPPAAATKSPTRMKLKFWQNGRPAKPTPSPRSPSTKLNTSTSLDSGMPSSRTKVPPQTLNQHTPITASTSQPLPPPPPEPLYSQVHHECTLSPPSTPSSTLSSIISTSSQEIEIQNNPAFQDSGDERMYATADIPSPQEHQPRPAVPPPRIPLDMTREEVQRIERKFEVGNDAGQYSMVTEVPEKHTPHVSPRRNLQDISQQPEPYYSEVNM
ncbi:shootin-1-like isoform X1 [Diadema antillarum]|uniref:shootin-1-like isoform X1 n=1 Tax=Diadema antillarum TaxID=105358 RepID=UPI003A8B229F